MITGYKIRYREKGRAGEGGQTKTTDGNRRLYSLDDLRRNTQYSIKVVINPFVTESLFE